MRQIYLDNNADNQINKLSFYSPSEGFVAFTNYIGYTQDSGRTFTKKYITLNNVDFGSYSVNLTFGFGINGIKAINQNSIIVYGDYGFVPAILSSTNGGNTFKLIFFSQFEPMQLRGGIADMVFPETNTTGFAADPDRILKTTNQGLSWSVLRIDPGSYYNQLLAVDNNTVFALSTGYATNKLIKTINGGASWQIVSTPSLKTGKITAAYFFTSVIGWLSMYDNNNNYYFYKTINGGSSWNLINNTQATPFSCFKMHFTNVDTGYALTGQNRVYKTLNSGITWEQLPRDNNYVYLGYSHNDLQCYSTNQLWAGGGHGFLEMNTNAGGTPLATAYFNVDTTGSGNTNVVNLINFSRTGYSYKWFVNNVQISSSYNASYTHTVNKISDTIRLVVSNGFNTDTLEKNQQFFKLLTVTGFAPSAATDYTTIAITGTNFYGATAVSFGGVNAINFAVISDTQVNAIVIGGASGAVKVVTPEGSASLNGFTYFAAPDINLPVTISDSILCKAASVKLVLQNTQANVLYELIDSQNNVYGFVTSNGGTIFLYSTLITKTGNYTIRASRININAVSLFTNKIFIQVEHTKALFTANRQNISTGENVNLFNNSLEANTFKWQLNEDANYISSTLINPPAINYASAGQKTLVLICTSSNGCKDTLATNNIFVYTKPSSAQVCFAQNVRDSDINYYTGPSTTFNKVLLANDNGFFISGYGNKPILKSSVGNGKSYDYDATSYFAKYTTNGVLSWQISLLNTGGYGNYGPSGKFTAQATDSLGNIYIVGYSSVLKYLTLINGDSIKISATVADTISYSNKTNGFILKLDSMGNYLWHTVIYDPTSISLGYPTQGGLPTDIKIRGNQILISGSFLANLGYLQNGLYNSLVTLKNNVYSNDLQNNFILKIKDDGSLLWNMYFENDATNQLRAVSGIGIDNINNYYITGYYEDKVKIHDAGNINNITLKGAVGSTSAYLLKFDSTGKLIWKTNMGNDFNFKKVQVADIATDASGQSYITGSSSLADSSEYFVVTNSDGTTKNVSLASFFLLKFDASGICKWAAGSRYAHYGRANAILLKNEDIYTTANIYSINGGLSQFSMVSSDGSSVVHPFYFNEFLIANYNTNGILKRITKSGSNDAWYGTMLPNNLVIDHNNNFILSGIADRSGGGDNSLYCFTSTINASGLDGFYSKINPDYCYSGTPALANAGTDKTTCLGIRTIIGTDSIAGNRYSWISKPASFTSSVARPSVAPTVTTTYFLSVINAAGFISRDTMVVAILPSPVANAGIDQNICKAATSNIGNPAIAGNIYSWASSPAGYIASTATAVVSPLITTTYYLTVTNAGGCTQNDTVTITVNTVLAPSVSISVPDTSICKGVSAAFTALAVNGGNAPVYQWKVNGVNAGTNSNIFNSSTLNNFSKVTADITSNASCALPATATSNVITMEIGSVTPSVSITSTGNTICSGKKVTFTATPVNEGTNPIYKWKKNGMEVFTGGNTYNTNSLLNGDVIAVFLTSNASCANPATVNSTEITITVIQPSATITISGITKAPKGVTAAISSLITNTGTSPAYQWQDSTTIHNWLSIGREIYSTISYTPALTGDKLRCILSSNNVCTAVSTDTSNVLQFNVDSILLITGKKLKFYPNPVTNKLTIESLSPSSNFQSISIISTDGKQNSLTKNISGQTKVVIEVRNLAPGLYIAVLRDKEDKTSYFKFVKK